MKDLALRKHPTLTSFPTPSSSLLGMTFYHSGLNEVYVCDGTQWIPLFEAQMWYGTVESASGSSNIGFSASAPSKSEGVEIMSQSITPRSNSFKYHVQASITLSSNDHNRGGSVVLWRDNTFLCAAVYQGPGITKNVSNNTNTHTLSLNYVDAPNKTSATVYSMRVGSESGTWYVGRRESENTFGGLKNGWTITERVR